MASTGHAPPISYKTKKMAYCAYSLMLSLFLSVNVVSFVLQVGVCGIGGVGNRMLEAWQQLCTQIDRTLMLALYWLRMLIPASYWLRTLTPASFLLITLTQASYWLRVLIPAFDWLRTFTQASFWLRTLTQASYRLRTLTQAFYWLRTLTPQVPLHFFYLSHPSHISLESSIKSYSLLYFHLICVYNDI